MNELKPLEQHSLSKSLLLHLFPGLLISITYFLLIGPLQQHGYPSIMSVMLAIVIILIPFELGFLLIQGKKKNKRFSLKGIISYQQQIPVLQYFLWVPVLFILLGLIFTLFKPVDAYFQEHIFSAWPLLQSGLEGGFSKSSLITTYVLVGILGAILAPTVEEFYFRGYLLPRMGYAGKWAPLLHSFLFAVYHFFTPWLFITRTVAMLPLIYVIRRKNIYVGIIVHILVNFVDVIAGITFIVRM
jgi:hypothetical protein